MYTMTPGPDGEFGDRPPGELRDRRQVADIRQVNHIVLFMHEITG